MENTNANGFEELFFKIKDYITTAIEIKKLTLIQTAVLGAGILVSVIVSAVLAIFFLIFFSIGLSLYISHLLDSSFAGFFIVALLYLIIALAIFFGRDKIALPISNMLVKNIFKNNND